MWAGCSQVALAHDACSTWGWEGTVFSKSRLKLGSVHVGGSAPVVVQSMTAQRQARCHRHEHSPALLYSYLSLIHISEPTRRTPISYAVFCLKKQKKNT